MMLDCMIEIVWSDAASGRFPKVGWHMTHVTPASTTRLLSVSRTVEADPAGISHGPLGDSKVDRVPLLRDFNLEENDCSRNERSEISIPVCRASAGRGNFLGRSWANDLLVYAPPQQRPSIARCVAAK
jgi:hypothetical protein